MYTVWIKVDETLPWIELKGEYQTKSEARKMAKEFLKKVGVKVVSVPEKKRQMKALATIKYR